MNKEEFHKYLKSRYKDQIAWYGRKSVWNRRAYQIFQWTAIILSASTPVLIVIGEGWVKWLAVVVAALVAISTAALKTFKYQENWISYRTTAETLKKQIHFYEASIQGYENVEDKEALFVERVESLISRENTLWLITHEKKEHPNRK
ncbi:DUF4231 domain-containing protein [Dehalococcoidia bacterium]|nr:DUF4231 domain-containing protein [Dehalococcoidia bacterium]